MKETRDYLKMSLSGGVPSLHANMSCSMKGACDFPAHAVWRPCAQLHTVWPPEGGRFCVAEI